MASHPFYVIRAIGGILFLSGMFLMLFNVLMTIKSRKVVIYNGVTA